MLDLFNIKKKKQKYDLKQISWNNNSTKVFPSPLREWDNSIYTFNNNTIKLMPSATNIVMKLIKNYFNLFNRLLEMKARKRKLKRKIRKLSSNRYYISNGGFKHTNNKLIINLYVFNRQKTNYLFNLKKRFIKRLIKNNKPTIVKKDNLLDKLKLILIDMKKKIPYFKVEKNIIKCILLNNNKTELTREVSKKIIKTSNKKLKQKIRRMKTMKKTNLKLTLVKKLKLINKKGIKAIRFVNRNKLTLIKALDAIDTNKNLNINKFNSIYKYADNFYRKLIKKSLRKMRLFFYYKQLLFINKSKTNYNYLQYLKVHLQKIFNKNVEFNIINIKRFYLNSDILSESVALKISKNRKKLRKYLNKLKNKVGIWKKSVSFVKDIRFNVISTIENISENKHKIKNHIKNNLRYKHITGFRLEAKGRLSRRFTASRSLYKLRYKGNLLDLNSSHRGSSSNVLRGNLKSNIQFTRIKSKSRIGSFGIKGWINGN